MLVDGGADDADDVACARDVGGARRGCQFAAREGAFEQLRRPLFDKWHHAGANLVDPPRIYINDRGREAAIREQDREREPDVPSTPNDCYVQIEGHGESAAYIAV